MLEELTVSNYALIDKITVNFGHGFNVLTGETGAGKSILIDALSLILGAKGFAEEIRAGAEEAEVTAIIRVSDIPEIQDWSVRYGIHAEDETFLIRRVLRTNGRGIASVQAVPVPRTALAELGGLLVDMHGQHDHQSLFQISTHRKLLDRFANLEDRVKAFAVQFVEFSELGKRIDSLCRDKEQTIQEIDFLQRALSEIESANLKDGEEEQLSERQKYLARYEEFTMELQKFLEMSAEQKDGALKFLRNAGECLTKVLQIDPSLTGLSERLSSAFYEIEDIVEDIRQRLDSADFDANELNSIDERLSLIANLEKKYKSSTIAGVLSWAQEAKSRLGYMSGMDEEIGQLRNKRKKLQDWISAESEELTQKRKEASGVLQQRIESHLNALGMPDAHFEVSLGGRKSNEGRSVVGPCGADNIEFLLSANRGEPLKPLKSVASGGEISRVMLALKTVLAESDPVPTMIFDEVDAGIGGEVARAVGSHLNKLSKQKQVFCITHLASIAVFADNHIQVAKHQIADRIVTRVDKIDGELRVKEVARMLAGNKEDATSLSHATRLLEEHNMLIDRD